MGKRGRRPGQINFKTAQEYLRRKGFELTEGSGDRPYLLKNPLGAKSRHRSVTDALTAADNDMDVYWHNIWKPRKDNLLESSLSFVEWADLMVEMYRALHSFTDRSGDSDAAEEPHFISIEVRKHEMESAKNIIERVERLMGIQPKQP